ncbi:hypothetical protein QAD02_004194 [Eretmocerus hayati]|uniref:Uncharacterized protein n=2 Tax=Eretmocerus hayati TaxID=131215 RepID=A0ACC2NPX8_9HYME|nr:hypothetical protein QAD02_004189 [Eretmocerus hayati]KAJ8672933.1 hypothetical protein QAD02_004194 [Eretmocerus hayati]
MGKKSKKGKKKPKKLNFLNELETVTFEQQILDNNRQLARLRSRNEELEEAAEKLKEQLVELEENKADLTTHLQRVLQKKTEEAQELQERLAALEKLHKEEEIAFKKKEELMEQEYKTMENNLTAEIKLAAGKLNSLEDWRLARIDLMKKFEQQEKEMSEQEIRHKETLYETEKKAIISKAKMQEELEARLIKLAESFRTATQLRLSEATQRAVRDNAAMQRELYELLSQCEKLDEKLRAAGERDRELRLEAALREAEARIALNKVKSQKQKIELLATEQTSMTRSIVRSERALNYERLGEQALRESELKGKEAERRVRILQQNVQMSREQRDIAAKDTRDNCREIARLAELIARARLAVQQALLLPTETYQEEILVQVFFVVNLTHHPNWVMCQKSCEPEPVENFYEFGNLGLIPSGEGSKTDKMAGASRTASEPTFESTSKSSFSLSKCSCE